jgi:hypothetical protein
VQVPLLDRSKCEVPLWSSSGQYSNQHNQFDNYFAGYGNEVLSVSYKEEIFDAFRRSIEECDHIDTVNVYADIFDGFGGLCCSLLEEIKQEMPSVYVPVWGMTSSNDIKRAGSSISKLMSIPFAYYGIMENASVIVPVDARLASSLLPGTSAAAAVERQRWESESTVSGVLASAIDTAFDIMNTYDSDRVAAENVRHHRLGVSIRQWGHAATGGDSFPMCKLEATAVDPFNSENQNFTETAFNSQTNEAINPFMKSLSATNSLTYQLPRSILSGKRSRRAYANVIGHIGLSVPGNMI